MAFPQETNALRRNRIPHPQTSLSGMSWHGIHPIQPQMEFIVQDEIMLGLPTERKVQDNNVQASEIRVQTQRDGSILFARTSCYEPTLQRWTSHASLLPRGNRESIARKNGSQGDHVRSYSKSSSERRSSETREIGCYGE